MHKYKLTISITAISAILTIVAMNSPVVMMVLERSPAAYQNSQWWRLFSPAVINRGGWGEVAGNLGCLMVVGALAERMWSRSAWLVFFASGAVVGELAGLAWKPIGAGASVAVCGLLGGIGAWLWWKKRHVLAKVAAAIVIAGGIALSALRNLHGPPLLAGFVIAAALILRERSSARAAST